MPRARNRFQRCEQVLAWLVAEYPCGRPVSIEWKPQLKDKTGEWMAHTVRRGRALEIHMSRRMLRTWMESVDTLLHEYAHAVLWGVAGQETDDTGRHHPPAFWAQYGEISDRWNHEGGHEEANEYGFR